MNILIKDALLDGAIKDIYIEGKWIKSIGENLQVKADRVINAKDKAIIPGFINGHTHSAMTLFRGYADDMKLMPWLEKKIWPNEAKMTQEDIYWGAKLAFLEMIKSGTTTFSDMYFKVRGIAKAAEEMGIRAILSAACFDHFDAETAEKAKVNCKKVYKTITEECNDRIYPAMGPHAIYTVSGELLKWINKFSENNCIPIHIHLAETEEEVNNSIKQFGYSPVRYLYHLGLLSPRLIIAHGIYVDNDEIRMLADHGVKVIHNPASNMKLASGMEFKFHEMKKAGIKVGLGTDGCASSNNLDMVEAMKLAALLGKVWRKDPEVLSATEVFESATSVGAEIFGLKCGKIAEGYLADLSLIELKSPVFTPNFNFVSNLVYAANGNSVDTVLCNGQIIMENRKVPGEEEIMEKTSERAYNLMK